MKRSILYVLGVVMLLVMGGCAKRVLISDEELAKIFRDAFLTNAYISEQEVKLDSIRLYDQIFENYGYTAEDVQYTIGNFSKRKSARLGDVVERAIEILEAEGKQLDLGVAILDSVNVIARRQTTHIVYSDSLVEFRSISDTTAVKVVVEGAKRGDYIVEFDYFIAEGDEYQKQYVARYWFESDDSTQRIVTNTISLPRNKIGQASRRFTNNKDVDRLIILLADIDDEEERSYDATFKRIVIRHIPSIDDAYEILFDRFTKVKIFDNDGLFSTSSDSL